MIQGIALRNILFSIENKGNSLWDLLEDVSIKPDELYKTETTISAAQLGEFLEKTTQRLNDLRIGLRIGFESPFSTLGMLGQIYQSCETYADALESLKKHIGLIDSINTYDFEIHSNGIHHITRVNKSWEARFPNGARQMIEHNIGFSVRSRREYLGREVKPILIKTPYAKIGERDLLEDYFACPIEYDAQELCIVLPLDMLSWKIPTANPDALQMYEAYIQRLKGQRNIWTEHTKQHISQQLKSSNPNLSLIASLMNLTPRSLQRRLTDEGFTFQQMLDDTRLETAHRLLMQPQLSIVEVSESLGFDVQNSFNRFLQKKIGKTPKELRSDLLK
ncbi:MAG: AraC family transcriptional regulator ligand-binding domain-containing protein [Bacteroidales bacterium]